MSRRDTRKKILFVLPSLVSGGAERSAICLLAGLDRERYMPSVMLFEKKGALLDDLPKDIMIYDLGKKGRFSFPALVKDMALIIKESGPSLIVSFLIYGNFVSILARAASRTGAPLMIIEHSVPSLAMRQERAYPIRSLLYKSLYPKADVVVTVSEGVKGELANLWHIPTGVIRVIPNPIDLERILGLAREPAAFEGAGGSPRIVAAGRLAKPKGYPCLLRAIKRVLEEREAGLFILGDGEERETLEELASELGISKNVHFLGFQKNPYKYIAKADIFVQASLWESFGISILEAMACGTPVVSTRCPHGPEDIITDNEDGLLVPREDEGALAGAIVRLLSDDFTKRRLSEAGVKRANDFGIEKIISEYENIFMELIRI